MLPYAAGHMVSLGHSELIISLLILPDGLLQICFYKYDFW